MSGITAVIVAGSVMFALLGSITVLANMYSLNRIKSRTVGDGQHGTARWANKAEVKGTYQHIPFTPEQWRKQVQENQSATMSNGKPLPQGIVVGCTGGRKNTTAMIDTGDVHALMIGAAGVGKTAYWLYPCIEYACASGMNFYLPIRKATSCATTARLQKSATGITCRSSICGTPPAPMATTC